MNDHKVFDFVDHIYVINLDKRPERWEKCQKELKKSGIGLENVERFSAVNGYDHPAADKIDLVDAYGNPDKAPGNLGCILSHLKAYEDADEREFEGILMLEDDVVFANDFTRRFGEYSQQIPDDWQFVYFGGNNNEEPKSFKPNLKICQTTWATHSYMIRPDYRNKIIKRVYESGFGEPIDNIYGGIQDGLDFYIFDPRITIQREGFSDIVGAERNYDHVLKDEEVEFR